MNLRETKEISLYIGKEILHNAKKHKAATVGLTIFGGLILLGAYSAACSDLDPAGKKDDNEFNENDLDTTPEASSLDGTILENGVAIYLIS